MNDVCDDLLAEYSELASIAESLSAPEWRQPTDFYGWSPWDEVAHLCYFDETGTMAVKNPEQFGPEAKALAQQLESGLEISTLARQRYGHLDGTQLLAHWRSRFTELVGALRRLDAKARLPWYGPSMSARSFATARLMETWAHGQDIYDILHRARVPGERIRHIAHLGVSTFGWSFVNRKLPVPHRAPHVRLEAPGGTTWTWNEPSEDEFLCGSALDFCLVVTQRRHVLDTGLTYGGDGTIRWLSIAQCFAGPPAGGPAPGVRKPQGSAVGS